MRFRTTPKDFRLWIMDLHATVKRDAKELPNIAKARIRLDYDGVHATATDRYIVVDSLLKSDLPEKWEVEDYLPPPDRIIDLTGWETLKNNASTVHGIEITDDGIGVFTDKGSTMGDMLTESIPSLTVQFDPQEEADNFPSIDNLIKSADENPRDIDHSGRDGFRMELVKHIKDVIVEPRSIGMAKPGFISTHPPRATGIIMPVRIKPEG